MESGTKSTENGIDVKPHILLVNITNQQLIEDLKPLTWEDPMWLWVMEVITEEDDQEEAE